MLKRHPYLITILLTTIVSLVAWSFVPKRYGAQTKIVDEYKETDLAIGMNSMTAAIKDALQKGNEGINDIEVYCKILRTEDFARELSHKQVPGKGMTYGAYLADKDTIETILDNVSYSLTVKQQAVTIQVEDRDPLVAAQMLDSVTAILQDKVTTSRRRMAKALLRDAKKERDKSERAYRQAQADYAAYMDSHVETTVESEKAEEEKLKNNAEQTFKRYQETTEQYVRQKSLSVRSYSSFAVSKANSVPTDDNLHPIGYTIFAVVLALLAVKGCRLYMERKREGRRHDFGDMLSPWSITLIIWGVLMIAMLFRDPTLLRAPTDQFYLSLLLWIVFFCGTAFLTYVLLPSKTQDQQAAFSSIQLSKINRVVFYGLLVLSVVMTPLYVKKIMDVVMMFGTDDLASNIRTLAVYGNEGGFLTLSVVINEALMIVAISAYPNIRLWQLVWACSACLLNSLAIMEKGGILLVIFCVVYILYQRKVIKIRTIALLGILVVLLSWGFNLLREEDEAPSTKTNSLFGFVAMYLLSPPVAYCTLTEEIVPQFGGHSFPLVYYYLNKFAGGNYVFFDRLQEFVYVPVLTNVYTIFQPFYMDFGQLGIAIFGVFYGVIMGWAYRGMRNGEAFRRCLYIYFAYTLVLQFFQEYIFTGNMHIIELILFVYLCTQKTFTFLPSKTIRPCQH